MPTRLAQLKSSALEPEVEIRGTAGTPRAAWTQTVMERHVQAFFMRNSDIACRAFWIRRLKHETFVFRLKGDFDVVC